eukprot:6726-Heterococcus_DN1.PRE.5
MPCSDCTVAPASPRTVDGNGDFVKALDKHFPGTQREAPFIARCAEELKTHGFTADTCIACMGVCRDEFCDTLGYELKKHFGVPFMLRGLAGFIFCGKTGFGAAHAHSPIDGQHFCAAAVRFGAHVQLKLPCAHLITPHSPGQSLPTSAHAALHATHQLIQSSFVSSMRMFLLDSYNRARAVRSTCT